MEIYETWSHCFSCGFRVLTKEIEGYEENQELKKEPEDVQEKIRYISQLPRAAFRGLSLPTDNYGFYVVWPNCSFYKCRLHSGTLRYVGPRGHKAPLFVLESSTNILVVVEGELNALSLKETGKNYGTIASPGSATELIRHLNTYLTLSSKSSTVFIVVDKDIPGVKNGLKLKEELLKRGKRVKLIAVEQDLNEILQEKGIKGVEEWAKQNLEM